MLSVYFVIDSSALILAEKIHFMQTNLRKIHNLVMRNCNAHVNLRIISFSDSDLSMNLNDRVITRIYVLCFGCASIKSVVFGFLFIAVCFLFLPCTFVLKAVTIWTEKIGLIAFYSNVFFWIWKKCFKELIAHYIVKKTWFIKTNVTYKKKYQANCWKWVYATSNLYQICLPTQISHYQYQSQFQKLLKLCRIFGFQN